MGKDLLLSLQITGLGMGLVFAAIILLSWMMSLLTRFVKDKPEESDASPVASASPETAPIMEKDYKAQAAAVAVALALAETRHAKPIEPPTALVSAWQLGMRSRQLYQKGNPSPVRHAR
jgi:sodium pump decarboxylase gamma subunit